MHVFCHAAVDTSLYGELEHGEVLGELFDPLVQGCDREVIVLGVQAGLSHEDVDLFAVAGVAGGEIFLEISDCPVVVFFVICAGSCTINQRRIVVGIDLQVVVGEFIHGFYINESACEFHHSGRVVFAGIIEGSLFEIAVDVTQNPFKPSIFRLPRFDEFEGFDAKVEAAVYFGKIAFFRFALRPQTCYILIIGSSQVECLLASHSHKAVGVFFCGSQRVCRGCIDRCQRWNAERHLHAGHGDVVVS